MKRFVIILFTALLCVTEMAAQKHHHFFCSCFMKILPASKVFRIIRAEDRFHRQLFSGKRKLGGNKK